MSMHVLEPALSSVHVKAFQAISHERASVLFASSQPAELGNRRPTHERYADTSPKLLHTTAPVAGTTMTIASPGGKIALTPGLCHVHYLFKPAGPLL